MSSIHIQAENSRDAQEQLNAAESQLRLRAMQERTCGILVTRKGAGDYVLALNERVPYGMTLEEVAS